MMKMHITDVNGTTAVIHDDLDIESEEPVSEELRRFLERTKHACEGPVSLDSLDSGFLVDLYVETPVRRVEPASPEDCPTRTPWERRPARYGPPASNIGERTEVGSVDRGDGFGPDSATQSPSAGGAGGAGGAGE